MDSLVVMEGAHWVIMGEMGELGPNSEQYHLKVANHAKDIGSHEYENFGLLNVTNINFTDTEKAKGISTEVAVSTSVSTLAKSSPVDLDQ